MKYKVVMIVKDGWWSDQKELPTFGAARTHQGIVARKWSTSETAIFDGSRLLNYRESEDFIAKIKQERKEA